ncbi:uncharacterized protein PITG_07584 [Phytophthora infestans T30-4]|uniref:Uncharacterized protein n=1 Tax=Phytophthora infestans (strain T30-4) TaxID=403677 RepID=D0N8Q1_PHYIT|nr:uncharacterized protein PITG_07584 [Phytophthora infestans T30-4]EEY53936.1 conserved hypothetical protein [Phytophthora infestans T30-4]|eukprot:XP_002904567.1 conserved hypothetical protein [Phytophthora infestans T30-4]
MSAQDDEPTTYEETLERWALYDCSAIERARNNDEMRRLFQRFRATRGKPATATRTVTLQSLDKAWTSFVLRWNKEGGEAFERTLQEREATHARLSVGTLEAQVCQLSDDQGRQCCSVHRGKGLERWQRRGEESRDPHEKPWIQNESHRGSGPNWRYAEVYPHYAREARGRRAEREDRVRRMDAAITQRVDRLARRVEYLERENQELRHRRRRQDMAQGDHGSVGAEDDINGGGNCVA